MKGRAHVAKAIMVEPDMVAEDGTVLTFKVWPNASPEQEHHAMVWRAETLRVFYEPDGDSS